MNPESTKHKARAGPPPRDVEAVTPVDGLVVPVARCPFCRDAIAASERGKLACNACMAWHHAACWTEHGRCASCGGAESGLAGVAAAPVGSAGPSAAERPLVRPPPHPDPVDPVVAGVVVLVLGAVCALLTLALSSEALTANGRPSDALFLLPAAISVLVAYRGYTHIRDRR